MNVVLVGGTGFVGSNLVESYNFSKVYNSDNVELGYGTCPDILIYAGVRGTKFKANLKPEEDMINIKAAIYNITNIRPKKLILISTIDVFNRPDGENEDAAIRFEGLSSYGRNRALLEKWVKDNLNNYLIIRLPGIYGKNIKKNFIYDILHPIPFMLTENKYRESYMIEKEIAIFYLKNIDGFYYRKKLKIEEQAKLRSIWDKIGFTSLDFTDSRGIFQYYNLKSLWENICVAVKNNIKILNIATEPVSIAEIYKYIFQKDLHNYISDNIPYYNFKTKYDQLFNGKNGYIMEKEAVLEDIKKFIIENKNIKYSGII